jgi:hypothetical protein
MHGRVVPPEPRRKRLEVEFDMIATGVAMGVQIDHTID